MNTFRPSDRLAAIIESAAPSPSEQELRGYEAREQATGQQVIDRRPAAEIVGERIEGLLANIAHRVRAAGARTVRLRNGYKEDPAHGFRRRRKRALSFWCRTSDT